MYCKLFASLYQGTLRGRSNEILVFTNLLAHAGRDGTVDKHFRAISEETGLSMEEVKEAIGVLESPDPESRSPEENGSRIVRMDEHRVWGWRIVNYGKYRAIRSEEDRAEQNRLAQQRWRDHNKQSKPASATSKHDKPKEREEGDGEGKGVEASPPPARKEAEGPHGELIRRWASEYPKHHDGEEYLINGGKDGKAASELLKASKKSPEELQRIFVAAWGHPGEFNCKSAATLSGFLSRFNDIRQELNALHPKNNGGQAAPDYLKTEWPAWLKANGQAFVEYQFAAEFLRGDFQKERKAKG